MQKLMNWGLRLVNFKFAVMTLTHRVRYNAVAGFRFRRVILILGWEESRDAL